MSASPWSPSANHLGPRPRTRLVFAPAARTPYGSVEQSRVGSHYATYREECWPVKGPLCQWDRVLLMARNVQAADQASLNSEARAGGRSGMISAPRLKDAALQNRLASFQHRHESRPLPGTFRGRQHLTQRPLSTGRDHASRAAHAIRSGITQGRAATVARALTDDEPDADLR
jgi:hypothetical protein